MYKNNVLNLVLFIVVIALASVIYYSEKSSTELDRLSTIDMSNISNIIIEHNQHTTSLVKHKDGHWQLTQPVQIAANDFRINSILKLINAPVHSSYSSTEIDLHSTGLDKPDTMIKFDELVIAMRCSEGQKGVFG